MRATTKTRAASDDDTRNDEDEEAPSFEPFWSDTNMIFGIERGLSGQIALIGDFYFTSDVHYVCAL